MLFPSPLSLTSGAKAPSLMTLFGTAKAVPFPKHLRLKPLRFGRYSAGLRSRPPQTRFGGGNEFVHFPIRW